MGRLTTGEDVGADVLKNTDKDDRLQPRSQTPPTAWMRAVSYWSDYLTIIDVQGLDDPALRHAS
jgi:hypothetical protein